MSVRRSADPGSQPATGGSLAARMAIHRHWVQMSREHLVIRRPDYVAGTSDRPEVGVFSQTHASRHPVPWGNISAGESVWMKWSGGPIVARAEVAGYRQVSDATPEVLRKATAGFALFDLDDYWLSLPPSFSAIVIYLERERWLDGLIEPAGRSRGASWIVFDTPEARKDWFRISDAGPGAKPPRKTPPSRSRGSRTIPKSTRFFVFRRDDFTCVYCGRSAPYVRLQVDHRTAWSQGGTHDTENLVTACTDCNLGKGARPL